jgi:hypothetical protein
LPDDAALSLVLVFFDDGFSVDLAFCGADFSLDLVPCKRTSIFGGSSTGAYIVSFTCDSWYSEVSLPVLVVFDV